MSSPRSFESSDDVETIVSECGYIKDLKNSAESAYSLDIRNSYFTLQHLYNFITAEMAVSSSHANPTYIKMVPG